MSDSDPVEGALGLRAVAEGEREAGRPATALPHCMGALAILEPEATPDPRHLAEVLNSLGAIHEELSDYGEAECAYRRAAAIVAGIEDAPVGLRVQTMASLANIHRVQGRLEEAERLFLEALEVAEPAFPAANPAAHLVCLLPLAVLQLLLAHRPVSRRPCGR